MRRELSDRDYVYVWADGIHLPIRLEEDRLCLLVLLGVRIDGTKELIAIEDGYRESKESWASVLRSLRNRGMRAPVAAIGDGALGFWGAVRDVWPETKGQRCWFHKMGNVLDKLPKRLQPKAKKMLREIAYANTLDEASKAMDAFKAEFSPKHQRAVDCLFKDRDQLLTFFSLPAEHWIHLRTTNVIESAFATVRLRHESSSAPASSATTTSGRRDAVAMSRFSSRLPLNTEATPSDRERSETRCLPSRRRRSHSRNRPSPNAAMTT